MNSAEEVGAAFLAWLPGDKATRVHVLTDSDADGLPAAAVLVLALRAAGYGAVTAEVRKKFETAWSPEVTARLVERGAEALIVTDLGVRGEAVLAGVPTLLIDHHRPTGVPEGVAVISAYAEVEDGKTIATSGLLAYWCAVALCGEEKAGEWLWLAGISLLSDLGDKAPFAELAAAKKRFGGGALRDATSLLNAPRRTALADSGAGLELLLLARSPKELLTGEDAEIAAWRGQLLAAKDEVGEALAAARKLPPRFSSAVREELGADLVAVRMSTPCQVHPLVAQQWRGRFKDSVVFGVNTGFRPGWVHFSGRAPRGVNLITFLRNHRPDGADGGYGNGHDQAAGGALRVPVWNGFAREIGLPEDFQVSESE